MLNSIREKESPTNQGKTYEEVKEQTIEETERKQEKEISIESFEYAADVVSPEKVKVKVSEVEVAAHSVRV